MTGHRRMVEVRSEDGKLLCRLTSDGRTLEIVRRGVRYHVALAAVGGDAVLFVSALVEEMKEEPRMNSDSGIGTVIFYDEDLRALRAMRYDASGFGIPGHVIERLEKKGAIDLKPIEIEGYEAFRFDLTDLGKKALAMHEKIGHSSVAVPILEDIHYTSNSET